MINLNSLLTGQQLGGSWTLVSYPTSLPYTYTGPTGLLCSTCSDPFNFDTSCVPPGAYLFSYSVSNSCGTSTQTVTLTVDESGNIDPISPVTQCVLCSTPQAINVPVTVKRACFTSNLPTPINWTLVQMPGTTFVSNGTSLTNPFTVTFNPTSTNYRLFVDGCNYYEDFLVSQVSSISTTGTIVWNSYTNQATVNSQFLTGNANISKTLCATTNPTLTTLGDWTYQTFLPFTMGIGTSVLSVQLFNQAGVPTTFTLSSFLTGCAGTALIGDLTFTGANSTAVALAVQTCLRNATGCNSDISCTFGVEGSLTITSGAKHQPTLWWGIKKSTSILTLSNLSTFTSSGGFGVRVAGTRTYNWSELIQTTPCPNVTISATKTYPNNGSLSALLNTGGSDFNFLDVIATPNLVFTTTTNTSPTVECCNFV